MSRFLTIFILLSLFVFQGQERAVAQGDAKLLSKNEKELLNKLGYNYKKDEIFYFNRAIDVVFKGAPKAFFCGPAMTDEACKAVIENMKSHINREPEPVKTALIAVLKNKYGDDFGNIEKEMGKLGNLSHPVCFAKSPKELCFALFDAVQASGRYYLTPARSKAAKKVQRFYKNGRPFDG